jgi:hypothetical protein
MTTQQLNRSLRQLWSFHFRNVNKQTKATGPEQTIVVAVRATGKNNWRKTEAMRKDAVKKFTRIVEFMYPNADQHVRDYGPVRGRVFV